MQKNISQTQQVNESNAKASTDANLLALENSQNSPRSRKYKVIRPLNHQSNKPIHLNLKRLN